MKEEPSSQQQAEEKITDQSIMDEIETDLLDGCMPVGEVQSCLNHWMNKYYIVRKANK